MQTKIYNYFVPSIKFEIIKLASSPCRLLLSCKRHVERTKSTTCKYKERRILVDFDHVKYKSVARASQMTRFDNLEG